MKGDESRHPRHGLTFSEIASLLHITRQQAFSFYKNGILKLQRNKQILDKYKDLVEARNNERPNHADE